MTLRKILLILQDDEYVHLNIGENGYVNGDATSLLSLLSPTILNKTWDVFAYEIDDTTTITVRDVV